jgi:hypothetical protein
MRLGAFRKLGRCGLLKWSFLKSWTYAASFAVTAGRDSQNKCSRMGRLQRAPETCIPSGTRFRERTPRRLARRRTGAALTSNAAQVAGLGRILILDFAGRGFSQISRIEQIHIMNARWWYRAPLLIIRFLFSYTYEHVCSQEKQVCPRISEDFTSCPQPHRV